MRRLGDRDPALAPTPAAAYARTAWPSGTPGRPRFTTLPRCATKKAALHWDQHGKPEYAEFNDEVERAAAQLERNHADLRARKRGVPQR